MACFANAPSSRPTAVAYREFNQQHANWRDYTWEQMDYQVSRWQAALHARRAQGRVTESAVMLRNSPEWVMFDQAAMGLGPGGGAALHAGPALTTSPTSSMIRRLQGAAVRDQRAVVEVFRDVRGQLGGLTRILTGGSRWTTRPCAAARSAACNPLRSGCRQQGARHAARGSHRWFGRTGHHCLYVGHHRTAEGRDAVA